MSGSVFPVKKTQNHFLDTLPPPHMALPADVSFLYVGHLPGAAQQPGPQGETQMGTGTGTALSLFGNVHIAAFGPMQGPGCILWAVIWKLGVR